MARLRRVPTVARLCAVSLSISVPAAGQALSPPAYESGQPVPEQALGIQPGTITVHVTSNRGEAFFGRSAAFGRGPGLRWPIPPDQRFHYERGLCVAPCSVTLDPSGGPFRFVGPSITPSKPFVLSALRGDLDVHVEASSYGARVAGIACSVVGAAFATLGGTELLVWHAEGDPSISSTNAGSGPVFLVQGVAFLGVGVVLAAIGLSLWVTHPPTTVQTTPHSPAFASPLRLGLGAFAF